MDKTSRTARNSPPSEHQRLGLAHLGQRRDFGQGRRAQLLVDADQGVGVAALLGPAQREGGDVDAQIAELLVRLDSALFQRQRGKNADVGCGDAWQGPPINPAMAAGTDLLPRDGLHCAMVCPR